MTTITTTEELAALPVDAVIRTAGESVFEHTFDDEWERPGYGLTWTTDEIAADFLPAMLLYPVPDIPAPVDRDGLARVVGEALRGHEFVEGAGGLPGGTCARPGCGWGSADDPLNPGAALHAWPTHLAVLSADAAIAYLGRAPLGREDVERAIRILRVGVQVDPINDYTDKAYLRQALASLGEHDWPVLRGRYSLDPNERSVGIPVEEER